MMIKQTETGIYYLHDYIPTRNFPIHSPEEVAMSRMIWDYKDNRGDGKLVQTGDNKKQF